MSITRLSEKTGSAEHDSPESVLHEAIERYRRDDGTAFSNCDKLMVIALNTKDGGYHVNWLQAGMSTSQMLSLFEVTKITLLQEMGYAADPDRIEFYER